MHAQTYMWSSETALWSRSLFLPCESPDQAQVVGLSSKHLCLISVLSHGPSWFHLVFLLLLLFCYIVILRDYLECLLFRDLEENNLYLKRINLFPGIT